MITDMRSSIKRCATSKVHPKMETQGSNKTHLPGGSSRLLATSQVAEQTSKPRLCL